MGEHIPVQLRRFECKPKLTDYDNCDILFKLLNISSDQDENVRVFDEYDSLILVHHIRLLPDVLHVRGVIIDTTIDNERVVCKSFPHTEDLSVDDFKTIMNAKSLNLKNATVTKAYEGTVIRIFCWNDEMLFSTHKKINGYDSNWGGPTFGEMYNDISLSTDVYDKSKCYNFLLSHPMNRFVCKVEKPRLIHIGTFEPFENGMRLSQVPHLEPHENIVFPSKMTVDDEQFENIMNGIVDLNTCGLFVYFSDVEVYKVTSAIYQNSRKLRGSEQNLRMRYLQLMTEKREQDLEKLFPEHVEEFHLAKERFSLLSDWLADVYVERSKINANEREFIPKPMFHILSFVERTNPKNIRTAIDKKLEKCNGHQLNALIREMTKTLFVE